MKSPREILLHKHRAATPRLDALRHAALRPLNNKADTKERREPRRLLPLLWRELIQPCRGVWTGLAAAWVVIICFQFTAQESDSDTFRTVQTTPEVIMAAREQRRLLSEMIAETEVKNIREPSAMPISRPRSERRITCKMA